MTTRNDALEEAIKHYWGERCPDHDDGCACCQAWAQFDALKSTPAPPSGDLVEDMARDLYSIVARVAGQPNARFENAPPEEREVSLEIAASNLALAFPVIRDMCADEVPCTLVDPLSDYDQGYFDGVMAFQKAIRALFLTDLPGNGGQL